MIMIYTQKSLKAVTQGDAGEEEEAVEPPHKRSKKDKRDKMCKREVPCSAFGSTPFTSVNPTAESTPTPPSPSSSDVAIYFSTNRIVIHAPPNEDSVSPVLAFDQLNVPSKLRDALTSQGFERPTPIQACAWPALINGKDVVGVAETGSGKTLAFGIPALAKLLAVEPRPTKSKSKAGGVSTLVIAPTRELAIQTYETMEAFGRPWGVGCLCVFGGVDKDSQRRELQGKGSKAGELRIVVGTPGRLLDFVEERCLDLSR